MKSSTSSMEICK